MELSKAVPADDIQAQIQEAIHFYKNEGVNPTLLRAIEKELDRLHKPIPMILLCPMPTCGGRHIDKGLFATKPHHTHACQHCGHVWRPAIRNTVGVQFLPGFKDAE